MDDGVEQHQCEAEYPHGHSDENLVCHHPTRRRRQAIGLEAKEDEHQQYDRQQFDEQLRQRQVGRAEEDEIESHRNAHHAQADDSAEAVARPHGDHSRDHRHDRKHDLGY